MLKYNFERILKARGIDKPFSYLVSAGFSDNFATRVKNNRIKVLRLKELERLCLLFNCTPNDLYEWHPSDNQQVDKDHVMNDIRRTDKVINITQALNSVPLNKLNKLEELINQALVKEGPDQ